MFVFCLDCNDLVSVCQLISAEIADYVGFLVHICVNQLPKKSNVNVRVP